MQDDEPSRAGSGAGSGSAGKDEDRAAQGGSGGTGRFGGLLGHSPPFRRALLHAELAAGNTMPLLIIGESGTGKDSLARAIHAASARKDGRFVPLNAGAVPDDILDRELWGASATGARVLYPAVPRMLAAAQGGTLYLDDITRMSAGLQARLVNLLTTGCIVDAEGKHQRLDVRLITSVNCDPGFDPDDGRLRRDLYDRLAQDVLHIPALRERPGDASLIARTQFPGILEAAGLPVQPLPDAVQARIDALPWPGNLRQLLNTLRRMTLCPRLEGGGAPELPPDMAEPAPAPAPAAVPVPPIDGPMSFAEIERRVILAAIDRHMGSVQRAAEELELAASTLYRKLKTWQDSGLAPG